MNCQAGNAVSRRQVFACVLAGSLSCLCHGAPGKANASANEFTLKGTVYEKVGNAANIDPALLYALTCVESSIEGDIAGYMRPYPWTLRYGNKPFYGKNKAHAVAELKRILARHRNASVDIGLAQINSRWHGYRVKSLLDLLDPQTNLTVAAQILNENFKRYPNDAFRAIGAYHSFDAAKSIRYARYVVRVYSSLKEEQ